MNSAPAGFAFDWADLAFADKKPLKELRAIFIAAPRELSTARFKQLVKTYLPHSNILLGLAKEPYIDGFADQPQFRTLQAATVQGIIDRVNAAAGRHKIYTLYYFQRELPHLLEKLRFQKALLINGSWHHVFHATPAFYTLTSQKIPYELLSPFTDEAEAKEYERRILPEITAQLQMATASNAAYAAAELPAVVQQIAEQSFDYGFQTGALLAKPHKNKDKYTMLLAAYNEIVPYETYALHHGASRETHFSPPNDLNHYDTVHAEVLLLVQAQQKGLDLRGTSLFINLMPCPPCARMLVKTDIAEVVYSIDHSDGYAVKLLEAVGKKVRRVVP